ncbi:MAG: molybdopterin molybdotransferase MoeA [Pseudomonadales bacterium]|nr:molybdopterin molybdotransferase MoeA [Pseudomonadales bacterium]
MTEVVAKTDFKIKPLIPVTQALENLLADVKTDLLVEQVDLKSALGRTLAERPIALVDVPPQDNSSMDGYAVAMISLNAQGSTILPLSQRIAAGDDPQPLAAGTVARIFTGAEIPLGADAVIMQEQVTVDQAGVHLPASINDRQNIRPRGQDLLSGEILQPVGKKLQAADIGVLASAGIAKVSVYRALKIAILSTGDELLEPGDPVAPGKIYNSNRAMLTALIQQLGMQVVDIGKVADTFTATRQALAKAADCADLIISTGGVSVGEEDHIKAAVDSLGALDMWRIKLKPGKPLAYGRVKGTPIFGLPGNPASALITFCLFARPYMTKLQGGLVVKPLSFKVIAAFEHLKAGSREEYLRAVYSGGEVQPFKNQSSGMLSTASRANGLIVIPVDAVIQRGELVDFIPFSELLA